MRELPLPAIVPSRWPGSAETSPDGSRGFLGALDVQVRDPDSSRQEVAESRRSSPGSDQLDSRVHTGVSIDDLMQCLQHYQPERASDRHAPEGDPGISSSEPLSGQTNLHGSWKQPLFDTVSSTSADRTAACDSTGALGLPGDREKVGLGVESSDAGVASRPGHAQATCAGRVDPSWFVGGAETCDDTVTCLDVGDALKLSEQQSAFVDKSVGHLTSDVVGASWLARGSDTSAAAVESSSPDASGRVSTAQEQATQCSPQTTTHEPLVVHPLGTPAASQTTPSPAPTFGGILERWKQQYSDFQRVVAEGPSSMVGGQGRSTAQMATTSPFDSVGAPSGLSLEEDPDDVLLRIKRDLGISSAFTLEDDAPDASLEMTLDGTFGTVPEYFGTWPDTVVNSAPDYRPVLLETMNGGPSAAKAAAAAEAASVVGGAHPITHGRGSLPVSTDSNTLPALVGDGPGLQPDLLARLALLEAKVGGMQLQTMEVVGGYSDGDMPTSPLPPQDGRTAPDDDLHNSLALSELSSGSSVFARDGDTKVGLHILEHATSDDAVHECSPQSASLVRETDHLAGFREQTTEAVGRLPQKGTGSVSRAESSLCGAGAVPAETVCSVPELASSVGQNDAKVTLVADRPAEIPLAESAAETFVDAELVAGRAHLSGDARRSVAGQGLDMGGICLARESDAEVRSSRQLYEERRGAGPLPPTSTWPEKEHACLPARPSRPPIEAPWTVSPVEAPARHSFLGDRPNHPQPMARTSSWSGVHGAEAVSHNVHSSVPPRAGPPRAGALNRPSIDRWLSGAHEHAVGRPPAVPAGILSDNSNLQDPPWHLPKVPPCSFFDGVPDTAVHEHELGVPGHLPSDALRRAYEIYRQQQLDLMRPL